MKLFFALRTFSVLSLSLASCILLHAQVQINKPIHLNGGTSDRRITNLADPTAADQAVNAGVVQTGALVFAAETGAANAYVVNLTPAATAYTTGMVVNFIVGATHANTGASTLQVNGLTPAKPIKKAVNIDLVSGDIAVGQMVSVIFDGTNFQLLSGSQGPAGTLPNGASAGNTPYWNGTSWVVNNSNIYNNGGNVGIGTVANPQTTLHVHNPTLPSQIGLTRGADNMWALAADIYVTNGFSLNYYGSSAVPLDYSSNTAYSKLFINAAGDVGIGTVSPNVKLEIVGGANALRLRNTSSTGYTGMRIFNDMNDPARALEIDYSGSAYPSALNNGGIVGEAASIATIGNYPLMFGTSNTARMTITGGGNIGVGTTAPSSRLQVDAGGGSGFGFIITRDYNHATTTSRGGEIDFRPASAGGSPAGAVITTNYWGAASEGRLTLNTYNNSDQLVLNENGSVGVGTNAPPSTIKLDVAGSVRAYGGSGVTANATDKGFFIAGSSGGFQVQIDNDEIQAMNGNVTSSLYINPNGANTYLNSAGGNVGIGTTAPQTKLSLNSGVTSPGFLMEINDRGDITPGSWTGIRFGLNNLSYPNQYGKGGIIYESRDGYNRGKIHLAVNTVQDAGNVTLADAVLTVDGTTGNVGVGATSPAKKLDVNGSIRAQAGILFGTDVNAVNTLNDYEEGTWTPILAGTGGGSKTPAGANQGWYIKVGNLVTYGGTLDWNGGSALTGLIIISGLPYASTTGRAWGSFGVTPGGFTTGGYTGLALVQDPGNAFVYVIQTTTSSYNHNPGVNASGTVYGFGGSYRTN